MTEETPTPAADEVVVVATQVADEKGVIAEAATVPVTVTAQPAVRCRTSAA